jgi:hypothetical protein
MTELKSYIDEIFKISIDICNDLYSNEEYGKINIGKIKHPEGRYIIHKIEFDAENNKELEKYQISQTESELWNQIDQFGVKIIPCGSILIDNFGERYIFLKGVYNIRYSCGNAKYLSYPGRNSSNIKGNLQVPPDYMEMSFQKHISEFEYQLIPSINEYEYPLTNKIIDFVKSQTLPIDNLNKLSNIMSSIEFFKKTYNDKNTELLYKLDLEVKLNSEISSKLEEQLKLNQDLQTKLDEQLKLNKELHEKYYSLI